LRETFAREKEFLRTRILINPLVVFPRKLRTNLNARFIFFHRAGGNTFLQNLLFPPAERERDLFKKAFRERERERVKTYTFIIYIKREKERERNFGQIAPLRLRESHIVLVQSIND